LPEQLARVVEGVLQKGTFEGGKLAIGLALALRRLDLIEMIYLSSRALASTSTTGKRPTHDETLLRYVLSEVTGGSGGSDGLTREVRGSLLKLLVRLFLLSPEPDYASITAIYLQLEDAKSLGSALAYIDDPAEAYQVAFDIAEAGTVGFRKAASEAFATQKTEGDNVEAIKEILSGAPTAKFYLNFLEKNNQTDWLILKNIKDAMEDRFSIYHSAITFTNAFANSGTTHDRFLRENLEWLGRASNWAKFSTTAALGVIHKGSYVNGLRLVKPYLPGGSSPNHFSEGGGLYALGLIFAGGEASDAEMAVLKDGIKEGMDPVVQHGAALGLGLTAMASGDDGELP
jgi:26S proteasome regulatory subunit N2